MVALSTGRATPWPRLSLMLLATLNAVVKSGELRLITSIGSSPKALGTARSTRAPLGIRPEFMTLTVTLEPSAPSAPKPLTTRLPCAMA